MPEVTWLFPGALVEYCHDGTWRLGATRIALVLSVDGAQAEISVTRVAMPDVKKTVNVSSLREREMWRTR